jgi:dolichol-phosphate mannosyltransferase
MDGTQAVTAVAVPKPASDVAVLSHSELRAAAFDRPIELTIVVPTFNESANVPVLVERLETALAGIEWEVVFVDDDSPDETAEVVSKLAQKNRRVRRLLRIGRRGLSTACIEGMLSSSAPFVAVMDGDLQHDENAMRAMLVRIRGGDGDLAVGTRYADGGSTGAWNATRMGMSRFATRLSKLVAGVELSDPMSGFFLMRRDAFNMVVRSLSGLGFKILLDIVASSQKKLKIVEIPFTFRERTAGESKLDAHVLWDFLMLLLDKKFGKWVPARFMSFVMIGGFGVVVHFAVLTTLFELLKVDFTWSQGAAASVAMVMNYTLNNMLTYRDRRKTGWRWLTGLISFVAVCSLGAFANVGIASYMHSGATNWALAALVGIIVGAVWNYAVTAIYTWKK